MGLGFFLNLGRGWKTDQIENFSFFLVNPTNENLRSILRTGLVERNFRSAESLRDTFLKLDDRVPLSSKGVLVENIIDLNLLFGVIKSPRLNLCSRRFDDWFIQGYVDLSNLPLATLTAPITDRWASLEYILSSAFTRVIL